MRRHVIRIGETIATLIAEERFLKSAKRSVLLARKQIMDYIKDRPDFETSLDPLEVSKDTPLIIKMMAEVGLKIGVGPMASVAGAIAQCVVENLVEEGASHIIFDNGGDIALYLDYPVLVGIYAGQGPFADLAFRIDRPHEIFGICTSSATVGHSLSLGVSDASIVISPDVTLADATATALGNAVARCDTRTILEALTSIGIGPTEGLLVIAGGLIGVRGTIPEIVRAEVSPLLISRSWRWSH